MIDVCKSLLYIGMRVRVCAEDRSENVMLEGGFHMFDQSRSEKEVENACPM